ncbi:hypothetical protein EVAR_103627_1 [Eumeta japonica]|uniref:Uncharacterized protein n=1 Tax=Eumeta variegata TaxID=151549 RepID=A0A4C1ZHT7_EUMVA|nr:hypothetical protein EVAR_103627_1 [Eumeta japonica]
MHRDTPLFSSRYHLKEQTSMLIVGGHWSLPPWKLANQEKSLVSPAFSEGIDASRAERLGRLSIACSALSLTPSAQAERDNESCFFGPSSNSIRKMKLFASVARRGEARRWRRDEVNS